MKIKICMEVEAEQHDHFGPASYAVISITHADLEFTDPKVKGVLRLCFDDVDLYHYEQYKHKKYLRLFSQAQALQIAEFAHRHHDNLLIHCHAGISRSPAVALALLEHYEGAQAALDFLRPGYYLPNWYVFKVLSEVLKEQLS